MTANCQSKNRPLIAYAIWDSYRAELVTGTADPDETMEHIAELMYATGLQEPWTMRRAQLDAYLE